MMSLSSLILQSSGFSYSNAWQQYFSVAMQSICVAQGLLLLNFKDAVIYTGVLSHVIATPFDVLSFFYNPQAILPLLQEALAFMLWIHYSVFPGGSKWKESHNFLLNFYCILLFKVSAGSKRTRWLVVYVNDDTKNHFEA